MTSCTGSARRILGILKKVSWVENWSPNQKGRLSLARRGPGQVSHEMGDRWKSQNRKNVYFSPYVEEPINSKVIKSFVPEQRSRVFRVSRFLCSMYIYMSIICPFRISVSWVWYNVTKKKKQFFNYTKNINVTSHCS